MGKKNKGGGGGGGGGHDGGGMMRWLLTYADLITLLVAFFVVMYASSQTDVKKFQAVAGAMQNAFNTTGGGKNLIWENQGNSAVDTVNPQDTSDTLDKLTEKKMASERAAEVELQQKEEKEFKKVKDQISQYAQQQGIANSINMIIDERGLVISIQDTVFFEPGKAELQPGARDILDKVAKIIYSLPNQIRIEGHTDNDPIHTAEYPDNWRLSTDRAVRVLVYLQNNHGFKPDRLSAVGYGEYRPVADNSTAAGKARNRRVDIVVLRSDISQAQNQTSNEKTIEDQLNLDQSVVKN